MLGPKHGYSHGIALVSTLVILLGGLQIGSMVGHEQLQFYLGQQDVTIVFHSTKQAKYYELAVGFDDLSFRSGGYQCAR